MSKITPFLWFEKDLELVINYYQKIFKNNFELINLSPLQSSPHGDYQTASIKIFDSQFDLIAAGPLFKFNESVSFVIKCIGQAEIDYYWDAITVNGGQESECGWCRDKYGLSWQVVPNNLGELLTPKTTPVMLTMKKLDIQKLLDAK